MAKSQWPILRVIKYLTLVTVLFVSCLDFKFESEYEDINGIYLEYIKDYDLEAFKLLFQGDTGYVMGSDLLSAYDFANVDSITLLATYHVPSYINDFLIDDAHAFLALPYELSIIDFSNLPFPVVGTLPIQDPFLLKKSGNLLYVATTSHLIAVDITDATNPIEISSYEFASSIAHFEIDSNFVYVLAGYTVQILDFTNPTNPNLINSFAFMDTMPIPTTFAKKGGFVYVSAQNQISGAPMLITYAISTDHTLNETSRISCPDRIRYFDTETGHVLAVTSYSFYLLNMEYPSVPCIGEIEYWGGRFGIINNNYIFIPYWQLVIFEIKQIE